MQDLLKLKEACNADSLSVFIGRDDIIRITATREKSGLSLNKMISAKKLSDSILTVYNNLFILMDEFTDTNISVVEPSGKDNVNG